MALPPSDMTTKLRSHRTLATSVANSQQFTIITKFFQCGKIFKQCHDKIYLQNNKLLFTYDSYLAVYMKLFSLLHLVPVSFYTGYSSEGVGFLIKQLPGTVHLANRLTCCELSSFVWDEL
ncbi:hypothetical protein EB796_023259 [Bugula neritina]|uniref:Uncharacterized protein n=1 Tax=Bugula neritina TaxID=10212 RepID=A0A7J7IWW2_BUGNE|nr:hypothetical protein EB796_023259 [Bugula neritina]